MGIFFDGLKLGGIIGNGNWGMGSPAFKVKKIHCQAVQ